MQEAAALLAAWMEEERLLGGSGLKLDVFPSESDDEEDSDDDDDGRTGEGWRR